LLCQKNKRGQFNNGLLSLTNAALLAAASGGTTALSSHAAKTLRSVGGYLSDLPVDFTHALRPWVCLVAHHKNRSTVYRLHAHGPLLAVLHADAKALFHKRTAAEFPRDYGWHRALIAAQVFSLVGFSLRAEVLAVEAALGLSGGFNAVHLRGLDGECARGAAWIPPDAKPACDMGNAYLDAALKKTKANLKLPLFVATDGQNPNATARLVARYGAKLQPSAFVSPPLAATTGDGGAQAVAAEPRFKHQALLVDMLLLMRAEVFVGNPASTLSRHVQLVRAAHRPRAAALKTVAGEQLPPDMRSFEHMVAIPADIGPSIASAPAAASPRSA
jgi:hypothetical protein